MGGTGHWRPKASWGYNWRRMDGTPTPRSVLSGAIRSAFDSVARALDLSCQIERDSWVLYAGPQGSLAIHCEPVKGDIIVRVGRGKDIFSLPELLTVSGNVEAAQLAGLAVATPDLIPARLARLSELAHAQGAFLLSKDQAFYRRALKRRRAKVRGAARRA